MEINVLESKSGRLVFELKGTTHTLCNALKEALREDDKVALATYSITHPLQGIPKFIIETKSGSPKDALNKAIKNLKKKNADFLKAYKAMK